jgi:hypothetical protein
MEQKFLFAEKSKCFRHINMPFTFIQPHVPVDLTSITSPKEIHININSVDAGFMTWLHSLGLYSIHPRLFVTPPRTKYNIHVDILFPRENTATYLNFPFNDAGSFMRWFNLKKQKNAYITTTSVEDKKFQVINAKEDDCSVIEIMQAPGNSPILVNAGYLHDLTNTSNFRHCWSFPLLKLIDNTRINWDEAVEIFSAYIKN